MHVKILQRGKARRYKEVLFMDTSPQSFNYGYTPLKLNSSNLFTKQKNVGMPLVFCYDVQLEEHTFIS